MTVDLLTYGETMGLLDSERVGPLRLGGSLRLSTAGAESTVAIGVSRLGGSARWVGVVGDDEVGRLVVRTLDAERVLTDGIAVVDDVPTSLLIKERRTSGVSRVRYYRDRNAGSRLGPEHVRPEHVAEARVVHLTGITPALSASARAAVFAVLDLAGSVPTRTCVDVNHRRGLWSADDARGVLTDMVRRADIVLATLSEASLVTDWTPRGVGAVADAEAAARALAALGPELVVVKLGAQGAVAWCDGAVTIVPPRPVVLVDPVGAGDAYAAGLLADLARDVPLGDALETGAAVAAVDVACPGDWEGLPDRADLAMVEGPDVDR